MIEYLLWITAGSLYGLLIGVIPIAGVTTALITVFGFADHFMSQPYLGLVFLTSIIASCAAADSYTSILTGIPGASATAACTIDGYPMARSGQAGRAMGIAVVDSLVNGMIYGLLAFGFLPIYASVILFFGIPEMMAFMLLAVACVIFVVSRCLWRSLLAVGIGLILGLIGQDPATGAPRMTGGWDYLEAGIQIVPVISGLFGIPELLWAWRSRAPRIEILDYWSQWKQGALDCARCWRDSLRGGVIGFVTGIIPGVGGAVGDFLAYGATVSRHPKEQFGRGNPRGLVGCEGANAAQKVGSMIPTVLFGVPAAPFAAMVMALCMYFGMELGTPQLLDDPAFVASLLWGFVGGTVLVALFSIVLMRFIVQILAVPFWIYAMAIMAVIVWANLQYTGLWPDLAVLLLCSALGIACKYWQVSRPAVLIVFVIAERLEAYTLQTLQLYDVTDLLSRPLFLLILSVIMVLVVRGLFSPNKGIDYA